MNLLVAKDRPAWSINGGKLLCCSAAAAVISVAAFSGIAFRPSVLRGNELRTLGVTTGEDSKPFGTRNESPTL
jgi:hypothetical protein